MKEQRNNFQDTEEKQIKFQNKNKEKEETLQKRTGSNFERNENEFEEIRKKDTFFKTNQNISLFKTENFNNMNIEHEVNRNNENAQSPLTMNFSSYNTIENKLKQKFSSNENDIDLTSESYKSPGLKI